MDLTTLLVSKKTVSFKVASSVGRVEGGGGLGGWRGGVLFARSVCKSCFFSISGMFLVWMRGNVELMLKPAEIYKLEDRCVFLFYGKRAY